MQLELGAIDGVIMINICYSYGSYDEDIGMLGRPTTRNIKSKVVSINKSD
jgi:hypothetical protein